MRGLCLGGISPQQGGGPSITGISHPSGLPSPSCLAHSVDFKLRIQQACPLPGRELR